MRTIGMLAGTVAVLAIVVSGGIALHAVTSVHAVARSSLPEHVATVSPLANFLALTQSNLLHALGATSDAVASAQKNVSNVLSSIPSSASQLASASAANLSPLQDIAHNIYLSVCPFFGSCPTETAPIVEQQPEPQFRSVTSVPTTPEATTSAIVTAAATPRPQAASQPTIINNITQPIKERVIERVVERAAAAPAASQSWFTDQLNQLENKLTAKISSVSASNATGPAAYVQSVPFAQSQKIDQLTNTTITNPTITGGSISGASVSANSFSLSGAFDVAVATIGDLTGTRVTFVRSTTTNATTSTLYVSDAFTFGINSGVLVATSGAVSALPNGSNGQVLKMLGGTPSWGTDLTGAGGGSSAWATTTDSLAVYTADPTQVVLVGTSATSTTGTTLEVKGNTLLRGNQTTQGAITASSFTATSSTASQFPYASTTAITATTASTSALIISGAPGGLLKTNATGVVSVASAGTDYLNSTAGDWSGTLGGFSAAQLIAAGFSTTSVNYWQTTRNFFASTSADYWLTTKTTDNLIQGSTNKYYATTLFATDLAGTTTDALPQGSVNKYWSNTLFDAGLSATTSLPNITTLANLSLPASQLTSFGVPFYTFFHATTTDALAQGTTNKYYSTQLFATDLAATTTTALAEGSNKYFTDARADARINATSSIGTLTSAPNLASVGTITSGTFSSAISGATINATPIGATSPSTAVFTNATSTNATTTNLYLSGTLTGAGLASCSGSGDKLLWNATTGQFVCGGDAGAGGGLTGIKAQYSNSQTGATQTFATSSDANIALTITSSGDTHTFAPSWIGTLAASRGGTGIGNPSAAGILLGSYAGGGWQQLATTSLGLLTTNVAEGSNLYYLDSRVQSFVHSSTTIPKTYSSNTFTGSNVFNGALTFGSLNGPLDARNGIVGATSSIGILYGGTGAATPSGARTNLSAAASGANSDITSLAGLTTALSVAQGGTGWAAVQSGAVPYGNGSSALATTSAGTPGQVLALLSGVPTWTATTTFSSGLTYSGGNVTNTGVTSNVAGSGISVSGATGAVTISNTGVLSVGPTNQTLSGNVTLATSTNTTNGLTSALTIVGSGSTHTFTPSISGTLTAGGGGTGISNPSASGLLLGGYAGGSWQQLATSSLGLLTTNVAEGSNLYYLDSRVQSFVHASTTIPKTYSSNTFTGSDVFNGALTFGSLNGPLDAHNGLIGATSSVGVLYGGTGATSLTGLLQGNGTSAITAVTGTTGQFPYYNGTNTLLATSTLFVSTASNVGIGTASPGFKLDVVGSARLTDTTGATLYLTTNTKTGQLNLDTGGNLVLRNSNAGAGTFFDYTSGGVFFRNSSFDTTMFVADSGNVGIGTTTPGSLLSIGNTNGINFSTATSTFNSTGGINLASGCFAMGGSCLSTGNFSFLFSTSTAVSRTQQSKLEDTLSVKDFGAVGDGSTDDTTAFQNATAAACKLAHGATVFVPSPPVNYKITSTINITCSGLTIQGSGTAFIISTASGATFDITQNVQNVAITGLHLQGPLTSGSYGIKVSGSGGVGATKLVIANNNITNFGDVATQNGAGIYINADSAGLSVRNNILNNKGYGVLVNAPVDTADISDNYITSSTGWCVKIANTPGAATIKLQHNNMTCIGGGIRMLDVAHGQILENEYEITGSITNATSTAIEVSNGQYAIENNYVNTNSHGNYGIYVDNDVTNSVIRNNTVANINTNGIKVGTGVSNAYTDNKLTGSNSLYSSATYLGYLQHGLNTGGADALTIGIDQAIAPARFYIALPSVAYNAGDAGQITVSPSSNTNMKFSFGYDDTLGSNGASYLKSIRSGVDYTPLLFQPTGGSVGIGTTTPGSLLSIGNTTGWNFFDNATTTSNAKGIDLRNGGCFAINGTCISGGGITALGSGYASTTNTAIAFSTSTLSFNGLTVGNTIVPTAGAMIVTPTVTGTLNNTGLTSSTISGVALGGTLGALTATNGSLTFSGSYTGAAAQTVGLNVGNANNWTALQTFLNASSTLLSAGQAFFGQSATSTFATNGALTLANALTYGGVTLSNSVTGTGSMVLSAAPTITGTLTAGTFSGAGTSLTGTAASLTAGTVTTNANLTGAVTSSGNATSLGSFSSGNLSGALTDETGSGGAAVFASGPTLTGTTILANFTATAASTTNHFSLVYTGNTASFGGTATSTFASNGALTLANALTYGGVTLSNAVTGTGNMVLSASPTLSGTLTAAAANFTGNVGIASTTPWAQFAINPIAGQASNQFVIGSSTATSFIVTNSGNVGIGTTTPFSQLSVSTAAQQSGVLPLFTVASTTNASLLTILGNGNVGIGTANPFAGVAGILNLVASTTIAYGAGTNSGTRLRIDNTDTTNSNSAELGFATADTAGTVVTSARISSIFTSHAAGAVSSDFAFVTKNAGTLGEVLRITGAGNVGIGTTSPPFKFTVDNAGSSGIVAGFENSSGECTINPTGSSVNCSSDITLKKNITSISTSTSLANILGLDPVFFNWNSEATGTTQHSGFIAQSVPTNLPRPGLDREQRQALAELRGLHAVHHRGYQGNRVDQRRIPRQPGRLARLRLQRHRRLLCEPRNRQPALRKEIRRHTRMLLGRPTSLDGGRQRFRIGGK